MGTSRAFYLTALTILTAAGCYPLPDVAPHSAPLRTVEVIELRSQPVVDQTSLIGQLEPWRETTSYFEVTGVVEKVFVEDGQIVDVGQPIASLVLVDFKLALLQANARREAAQADLDLLLAGTRQEDLDAAKADYQRAVALSTFWVSELKRNQELVARGAVPDSELERIKSEHDASQQGELATKAHLARAVAGPRKEQIEAARANAEALAQAVQLAQRQLEKATLKAPFRGRVERRLVDEGAYVNVFPTGGVPVVHLVDLEQVDALIAVPEALLPRLAGRSTVEVVSAVNPELRAQGEVISMSTVADPASGTYELRARIPNPDGHFRGGMVVTTAIRGESAHSAILIPVTAIRRPYGQSPYVLLMDGDSRVIAQTVELGNLRGPSMEVTAGLSDGQLLIVRGQHQVVAGDRAQRKPAEGSSLEPPSHAEPSGAAQ